MKGLTKCFGVLILFLSLNHVVEAENSLNPFASDIDFKKYFQYSNPFFGYVLPRHEFDSGAEFGIKSGYHFNKTYAVEYGLGIMPTLVNTHESKTLTLVTYSLEGKRYYTYQSFLEPFKNVHSFATLGFFGNFSGKQEFVQIRLGLGMDVDINDTKQFVFHFIVGNDVSLRVGFKQNF